MDAKEAAKLELTIDVSKNTMDRENDISTVSSTRHSYPELATEGEKKSEPTTERVNEVPGFSIEETTQKSTMVATARGYIQFGLMPEKTCINSNESMETSASNPNGEITCSGYVPLEGILKQQNNRQDNENKL